MVMFSFGGFLARLLGHLGGQHPKTYFSVIFGPFATNEKTTFLKFQKKFFHYTLFIGRSHRWTKRVNSSLAQKVFLSLLRHNLLRLAANRDDFSIGT